VVTHTQELDQVLETTPEEVLRTQGLGVFIEERLMNELTLAAVYRVEAIDFTHILEVLITTAVVGVMEMEKVVVDVREKAIYSIT